MCDPGSGDDWGSDEEDDYDEERPRYKPSAGRHHYTPAPQQAAYQIQLNNNQIATLVIPASLSPLARPKDYPVPVGVDFIVVIPKTAMKLAPTTNKREPEAVTFLFRATMSGRPIYITGKVPKHILNANNSEGVAIGHIESGADAPPNQPQQQPRAPPPPRRPAPYNDDRDTDYRNVRL